MVQSLAHRRVAIIGGTGFIGSHLAEHLIRENAHVTVIARSARRLDNLESVQGRFEFAVCDIMDRQAIATVIGKAEPAVVFHLAADPDAGESFSHMISCVQHNTVGTAHVLEAASLAKAQVLVYADSSKNYGNGPVPYREEQAEDPICSYAVGKSAGWKLCRLASSLTGIAVCALRPTFVYGHRQNWNLIGYVEDCVRHGKPISLQGGTQTRDLLYIDDAVRAFAAAAMNSQAWGHAIPIGGGVEITLQNLCEEILGALRSNVEIQCGAQKPRLTEVWRSFCDNAEATKLLNWNPRIGLREGLSYTLREVAGLSHNRKMLSSEPPAKALGIAP